MRTQWARKIQLEGVMAGVEEVSDVVGDASVAELCCNSSSNPPLALLVYRTASSK